MTLKTTINITKNTIRNIKYDKNNNIKNCYFCNENHICKECPLEKEMSPFLKKKAGNMMEHYIAENLKCPECNNMGLKVIGTHTPSLDLICSECSKTFEVKSKCLSVNNLPNDIILPHGTYIDYVYRLNEGLNLIVIIYGVNRIDKTIYIREVLYANNKTLKDSNIINVAKRNDSKSSTIYIKNKKKLSILQLETNNIFINFSKDVEQFKQKLILDKN